MLPENWDTVRAFLAAQTQWRRIERQSERSTWLHCLGLDYRATRVAVRAVVADGLGNAKRGRRLRWRDVFEGLREMENEVLTVQARRPA